MTRNLALFVLAFVAAGCTSEPWGCGMGAACPALADVGGVRYGASGAVDLVGIEDHLTPFAEITDTNMDGAFAEMTAYVVDGIDARALLIARNHQSAEEPGEYRVLWGLTHDGAFPAFCSFMTAASRAAQPECQGIDR